VTDRKNDFPIFVNTPHVYLDSAATTHKPSQVIDAITQFYSESYGTISRGLYKLSAEATHQFESTRYQVAGFIGAQKAEEIVFTSGATESINLVAHSYLRPNLQPGDEIIISILEHHANFIPWQQLAKEKKAKLRILTLDDHGNIVLEHLQNLLNERTRLVAITQTSNVTGAISPVKEIIKYARSLGVPVLVDGAQSAGHMPINVYDLDCDFFVFSGHKIYGPTGIGILYAKEKYLDQMIPYRYGGEMILQVTNSESIFKKAPFKLEAGTPNIAGVVGLAAAIKYLQSIGMSEIEQHEKNLTLHLVALLEEAGVQIIGDPKKGSSIVSFLLDEIHPHDVATILDNESIAVRAGHHCAQPFMRYMQIPATVRVSLGCYNDQEDLLSLVQGLKKARNLLQ
jgi:cysteine desulfurase/selenocysteine lyase